MTSATTYVSAPFVAGKAEKDVQVDRDAKVTCISEIEITDETAARNEYVFDYFGLFHMWWSTGRLFWSILPQFRVMFEHGQIAK